MTALEAQRIEELRSLEDGWWGEGSKRPSDVLLDDLQTLIPFLEQSPVHITFGCDGDGQIVFEWDIEEVNHNLEYSLNSIWMYSWSDNPMYENEVKRPYNINTVQELIYSTLA